jgi:ParB family chromosome partitioning protein
MSVKRGGLGRNLSALLQSAEGLKTSATAPGDYTTLNVEVASLQPGKYQPRALMDETALVELAESIKKQGLLQPLVVRELSSGRFEIVAGERRWRASQLAGMTSVPVLVRQVDDETAMAMALVENLQREALNAMDQARAMQRLTQEFSLTHQDIANLLSKSRTAVSNFLRLLHLTSEVQGMLERGDLDMGHARCLLMLDEGQQRQVAEWVVAKKLSVRETEAWVSRLNKKETAGVTVHEPAEAWGLFQEALDGLALKLNTKVSIKSSKSGKGTLMIHYDGPQNLQQMIEQLGVRRVFA